MIQNKWENQMSCKFDSIPKLMRNIIPITQSTKTTFMAFVNCITHHLIVYGVVCLLIQFEIDCLLQLTMIQLDCFEIGIEF